MEALRRARERRAAEGGGEKAPHHHRRKRKRESKRAPSPALRVEAPAYIPPTQFARHQQGARHHAFSGARMCGGVADSVQVRVARAERRNAYSQAFVDDGKRPQNFLAHDPDIIERFMAVPAMRELMQLKRDHVAHFATPSMGLQAELRGPVLRQRLGGVPFDAVIIDPPWQEYSQRVGGLMVEEDLTPMTHAELRELDVPGVLADVSFVFLWAGTQHMEEARMLLDAWGCKFVEDIVWIKQNKEGEKPSYVPVLDGALVRTFEHCIVGLHGHIAHGYNGRDPRFVHTNIDVDVIASEEPAFGSTEKPAELYGIVERLVQGRRRLELFGSDRNLRPGWVTVGRGLTVSNYSAEEYRKAIGSVTHLPSHLRIEEIRPINKQRT